jgi:threonine synthase
VIVSTASPYKFCDSVLDALTGREEDKAPGGLELIDRLEAVAGVPAPAPLRMLRGKKVRFSGSVAKNGMRAAVERFLGQ